MPFETLAQNHQLRGRDQDRK
uniref:Uncharacterized protein n=1 Tax=Anguilla anguilla TaxID=7936 RepID=A0A0E9PV39_ANGAN